MQNLIYIFALISSLSCSTNNDAATGNNNVIKETRTVPNFSMLNNASIFDVVLTQNSGNQIVLEGDENIMDKVVTKVENGTLIITTPPRTNIRNYKKMVVYVPGQKLTKITLDGTGDIDGQGKFRYKNMDVELDGTGDINLSMQANDVNINLDGTGDMQLFIQAKNMDLELDGTGDINLKGNAESGKLEADGTGDINAENFSYSDLMLEVDGTGDVEIQVTNYVSLEYDGTGDVNITGSPRVKKLENDGVGKVSIH